MENNYEIVDEAILPQDLALGLNPINRLSIPAELKSFRGNLSGNNSCLRNNQELFGNDSSKISKNSNIRSGHKVNNPAKSKEITEDIMSLISSFHSTAQKKKNNLFKKSQTKDHRNTPSRFSDSVNLSFGERLYRKSIALKENKELKVKEHKEESESKFKKEYSFRPNLSKQTYSINLKSQYDTESSLSEFSYVKQKTIDLTGTKRKEIESYQKRKEEEELKELKPSVKKRSKEIEEFTNKLFQEAERLKHIKQDEADNFYKTNYAFTPKISDLSQPKVENFYKRLQSWIDKRNEKFVKEKEQANLDSKTGLPFYKPSIHYTKNTANIHRNVFIDLYEEKTKFFEIIKEKQEKIKESIENLTKIKKVSHNSEEINQKNKKECFENMFNLLKDSEENLIRYNPVLEKKLENLKPGVRTILEPVVSELKEDKYFLNREEFLLVIEQLYTMLNVEERRRLIDWYVKGDERSVRTRKHSLNNDNFLTFQPKVREKSHRIFEKSERYSKNLIERNKEFLKKKQDFMETEKQNKMAKEIELCTFRPKIDLKVKGAYRIDKYEI